MASQVLSGTNTNLTYTNNTGQNVRVVINYCSTPDSDSAIDISFAGVKIRTNLNVFGRNLAFYNNIENSGATGVAVAVAGNNAYGNTSGGNITNRVDGFPTELMLAAGQVFSLTSASLSYNIVVIPEAG